MDTATFSNTIVNQAQTITCLQESVEKFEEIITNQAQTIKELETAVVTKDRDNQTLADQNQSQRFVLTRLNNEKIQDANLIKKLNEKIESKNKIILDLVAKDHSIEAKLGSLDSFMREYVANKESRKRKAV